MRTHLLGLAALTACGTTPCVGADADADDAGIDASPMLRDSGVDAGIDAGLPADAGPCVRAGLFPVTISGGFGTRLCHELAPDMVPTLHVRMLRQGAVVFETTQPCDAVYDLLRFSPTTFYPGSYEVAVESVGGSGFSVGARLLRPEDCPPEATAFCEPVRVKWDRCGDYVIPGNLYCDPTTGAACP